MHEAADRLERSFSMKFRLQPTLLSPITKDHKIKNMLPVSFLRDFASRYLAGTTSEPCVLTLRFDFTASTFYLFWIKKPSEQTISKWNRNGFTKDYLLLLLRNNSKVIFVKKNNRYFQCPEINHKGLIIERSPELDSVDTYCEANI